MKSFIIALNNKMFPAFYVLWTVHEQKYVPFVYQRDLLEKPNNMNQNKFGTNIWNKFIVKSVITPKREDNRQSASKC